MRDELPKNSRLRIVIAYDHFIVREGLRLILEDLDDFELVGDAADGASALRLVEERQPHVVLMDLRMPGIDGLEAIERIRQKWPHIAVVILTTYDDEELMLKGLRAGASGYLLKDTNRATLIHAIRTAARGETLLSSEVMTRLLARACYAEADAVQKAPRQHNRHATEPELTEREREVISGVARGERNKEIAARLGISEPTVKTHLSSIYYKLGVDSRASAVAEAIERGLLSLPKRSLSP